MHGSRMGLTLPYPPEKFKLKSVIKIVAIKVFISGVNINRVKPSMLYCYPST